MPATWLAFDADPDTGTLLDLAVLELESRTLELRKCFAGSAPPTDPQEGQLWIDTSGTQPVVYGYLALDGGGLGWVPLGPHPRLPGDLNFDPSPLDDRVAPFEAKGMRLENRSTLPALSPTNRGMAVFRLGDGEVFVADEGVSGAWKGLLSVVQGQSYDSVEVDLTAAVLGATPPTAASKGTTPAIRGYLFDAADESLTLHVVVPGNYAGAGDLFLDLDCVLDQAQGAGDDIDWSADLVAVAPGPAGQAVTKAGTETTPSLTDIGATNTGDGALHRCRLVLDHDDPDNPITAGALLAVEIHRTDLAQVGGVILVAARIAFPQRPRHERA